MQKIVPLPSAPLSVAARMACRLQREIQVATIDVEAAKEQYTRDVKHQARRTADSSSLSGSCRAVAAGSAYTSAVQAQMPGPGGERGVGGTPC